MKLNPYYINSLIMAGSGGYYVNGTIGLAIGLFIVSGLSMIVSWKDM